MKNWVLTALIVGALACPVAHAAQSEAASATADNQTSMHSDDMGGSKRAMPHHRHAKHPGRYYQGKRYDARGNDWSCNDRCARRVCDHPRCDWDRCTPRCFSYRSCDHRRCDWDSCTDDCWSRGRWQHGQRQNNVKYRYIRRSGRTYRDGGYGYSSNSNPQDEIDNPEKTNR